MTPKGLVKCDVYALDADLDNHVLDRLVQSPWKRFDPHATP